MRTREMGRRKWKREGEKKGQRGRGEVGRESRGGHRGGREGEDTEVVRDGDS